jgi:hypothetical protein
MKTQCVKHQMINIHCTECLYDAKRKTAKEIFDSIEKEENKEYSYDEKVGEHTIKPMHKYSLSMNRKIYQKLKKKYGVE